MEATWEYLSDFILTLTLEQKQKKVFVLIDDESQGRRIQMPELMEDDIYVNADDSEDCGTRDELQMAHEDDEEFDIKNYYISTEKGTPFLWTDFNLD